MALQRFLLMTGILGAAALAAAGVAGQSFPSKSICIFTAAAGGGVDFAARSVAQGITAPLGQQVVVENRGGSAAVAAELVAKSAQGLTDLVSGEVQMGFSNAATTTPFLKSGRLRALAVGSVERSALVPGVPTIAESGVPGYEAVSVIGLFAAAKTPANITGRLNQEVARVLAQPEVKERFLNNGAEAVGGTPEQLEQKVKGEIARMGKVIKDGGIRGE